MKKILGLLALAPLTIASCTEGDGGAGGKSMLTHLTSENTTEEIELYVDTYFGVEGVDFDLACYSGVQGEYFWHGVMFDLTQINESGESHTIVYSLAYFDDEEEGWIIEDDPRGYLRQGTIAERTAQKLLTFTWCEATA